MQFKKHHGQTKRICVLYISARFLYATLFYLKVRRTESTTVIALAILRLFVSWKKSYKIILLNCHTCPSPDFQSLANNTCAVHRISTLVVLSLFFIWKAEAIFCVKQSGIQNCFHDILSVQVHWYLQYE